MTAAQWVMCVALPLALGCSGGNNDGGAVASSAANETPSTSATAPPAAATVSASAPSPSTSESAAPLATSIPAPTSVEKVRVVAAPAKSLPICGGVQYDLDIDFVAGTWTKGTCDSIGASNDPLSSRKGTYSADDLEALKEAYKALTGPTVADCGKDPSLTLTITTAAGSSRLVSCKYKENAAVSAFASAANSRLR